MNSLAGSPLLWLDAPMAALDELQLRRLGPDEWPADADDPTILAAFLDRLSLPRRCVLAWQSGALSAQGLLERAALLRRAGRIAGLIVAAERFVHLDLAEIDRGVPLLIVLTPAQEGPVAVWQGVRARLSRLRSATLRFAMAGIAPCHLQHARGDLRVRPAATPSPGEPPAACAPCAEVDSCAGPGHVGAVVAPLLRPISNQFDLVERATRGPAGPRSAAAAATPDCGCPLAAGVAPPTQGLLVLDQGLWRSFVPDADAWPRAALAHVMGELGQVYLDVSRKARLDDFAADLLALRRFHSPHDLDGQTCPGAWCRRDAQPFAAEERVLRQELATLRGTIVDVGAGPVRYTAAFAAALAEGQLRYIAVEPDAQALARSAAALPGGIWLRGVGERLPLADGIADAVMLLRSYNHLRQVAVALREAHRVLRPGGTLLLVDNVGFGLARTPTQLLRARALPQTATPFEHYRDHNAGDAEEELRQVGGFTVELSRPVGPETSNQWLVRARRDHAMPALSATNRT